MFKMILFSIGNINLNGIFDKSDILVVTRKQETKCEHKSKNTK